MQKGGISRESASTFDRSSNPFDVNQASSAEMKKYRAKRYSKDVLESPQNRLEREVSQHFEPGQMNGKLLVVAKVAKTTFMIVVLPWYLLVYGIPKLLFVVGGPIFLDFAKKLRKKIESIIKGVFRRLTAPIYKTVEQVHAKIEKIKKSLVALRRSVIATIVGIMQPILNPIKVCRQAIFHFVQKVKAFNDQMKKLLAKWRITWIYLPQTISQLGKKWLKLTKEQLATLREMTLYPLKLFNDWVRLPIKKLFTPFRKGAELVKKVREAVAERVKGAYQALRERVQNLKEMITHPVTHLLEPSLKFLRNVGTKVKTKLTDFGTKARDQAKDLWSGAKEASQHVAQQVASVAVVVAQPVINLFVPIMNFLRGFAKKFQYQKSAHVSMIEKIGRIGEKLQRGFREFLQRMKEGKKWVVATYFKVIPKVKSTVHWIVRWMKKIFLAIFVGLRGAVYVTRLFFAWTRVTVRYGMRLVKEKTEQWID